MTKAKSKRSENKEKKVLIVEDEQPIARAMDLKLKSKGIDTSVVYNGLTALTTLERSGFDLMLLDLVMPKLDGFGVLKALKERRDRPIIIVVTNLDESEIRQKAKALGASEVLGKANVSLDELTNLVLRKMSKNSGS
jgi:DNA-binding response OmpR family regulator